MPLYDPGGTPTPVATAPKPAVTAPKPATSGVNPPFGSSGVTMGNVPHALGPVFDAIARAARELGVPVDLALAIAYHESGLNPNAVGDNGSSFGLFQLHRGGELGTMSQQQANDPYTNAKRALTEVASVMRRHPGWSYGQIAAAAQRPANQGAYAAAINGLHANQGSDVLAYYAGKPRNTSVAGGSGSGGSASYSSAGGGLPSQYDPNSTISINSYGYISRLAKSEPDLMKLMKKYSGEDLGNPAVQARLEADIRDTKWYTTHNDAWRKGEILKATDPAEFTKSIGEITPKVTDTAHAFLVPMSGASAKTWATKIALGQVSEQQYLNYVKAQAKSLFPGMSAAIDSGVTTRDYVQPYAELASKTLEIDPNSVNFLDPKWSKALFQVDPKTGARTAMSLADWQTTLRTESQYGFDKTDQARQASSDLGQQLAKLAGGS